MVCYILFNSCIELKLLKLHLIGFQLILRPNYLVICNSLFTLEFYTVQGMKVTPLAWRRIIPTSWPLITSNSSEACFNFFLGWSHSVTRSWPLKGTFTKKLRGMASVHAMPSWRFLWSEEAYLTDHHDWRACWGGSSDGTTWWTRES